MKSKMRIVKASFGMLLLIVVVVSLVHHVSAKPEYFSELQIVYGNGSCATCHLNSSGGGDLTGYGNKFASQSSHFKEPASALRTIGEPPINVPTKMSEYVLALQSVYGNGSCITCHVNKNGGDELTGYGKKFEVQPNHRSDPIVAIKAIGKPDETTNVTITEKTEKKSPGFEIAVTIGAVSVMYLLKKIKYKNRYGER